MVVSPHGRPPGSETPSAFVLAEDAPHDRGLAVVDQPAAGDRVAGRVTLGGDLVAVAEAAAGAALPHPAFQAASRLHRQILQEQRVHRPLEADVQLADLTFASVSRRTRAKPSCS